MTEHKKLQSFRIRLLKELKTLVHPHRLVEIPSLEDGIQDIFDRAHAEHEKSLFFHLQERQGCSIEKILQALKRIEEGTFGICEDCRGRIPQRRLEANPSATLCVQCQGIREGQGWRNISNGRRPLQLL